MADLKKTPSRSRLLPSLPVAGLLGAFLCVPACFEGGFNLNQVNPGNQDDGVNLRFGEIAVDPNGDYFLSRSGDKLLYGDIQDGTAHVLPGIETPSRVAFGYQNDWIFVTSDGSRQDDKLTAYDTRGLTTVWTHDIDVKVVYDDDLEPITLPRIEATQDDQHVIVTNKDDVEVLNVKSGDVKYYEHFSGNVRDVDIDTGEERVLFTLQHEWKGDNPETKIILMELEDGSTTTIDVPNCSDELVISPVAPTAFLAPTTCQKDPVSVIDLESGEWVRNLPGFGPVAIAPRGDMAIAFLDMDNIDADLFENDEQIPSDDVRYHLMFIDAEELTFDTMEIGDDLPRFAVTPDGKVLLVDSDSWFQDGRLRVLDIDTRSIHEVEGPEVRLEHFVITTDSREVYLLDKGLFRLNVPSRAVEHVGISFEPEKLNITPDDANLLLRNDDDEIFIFGIQDQAILHGIKL